MSLETAICELIKPLNIPYFWIVANLSDKEAKFPLVVINYLSDVQTQYLDSTFEGFEGRIRFTLYARDEYTLMANKAALRASLIVDRDWNFNENTGLTAFDENLQLYIYDLDFNFYYTGVID